MPPEDAVVAEKPEAEAPGAESPAADPNPGDKPEDDGAGNQADPGDPGEGGQSAAGDGAPASGSGEPAWKNEAHKYQRLTEKLSKQVDDLQTKLQSFDPGKLPQPSQEEQWKSLEEEYQMPREDIQRIAKLTATMTKGHQESLSKVQARLERKENELTLAQKHKDWGEYADDVNKRMDKLHTDLQRNPQAMEAVFYQVRGERLPQILEKAKQEGMRRGMEEKNVVRNGLEPPAKGGSGPREKGPAPTAKQAEFARKLRISPESLAKKAKEIADAGGRFPSKRRV